MIQEVNQSVTRKNPCFQVCFNNEELWDGVPLFGCFSYVNPATNRNDCCPIFCEALVLPCVLYGSNVTLMVNEASFNVCKNQPLGDTGVLATVAGLFAALCLWYPASPLFCLLVGHQRSMLRRRYFLADSCGQRSCDTFCGCLFAPCAVYQHFEFLTMRKDNRQPVVVVGVPTQQIM